MMRYQRVCCQTGGTRTRGAGLKGPMATHVFGESMPLLSGAPPARRAPGALVGRHPGGPVTASRSGLRIPGYPSQIIFESRSACQCGPAFGQSGSPRTQVSRRSAAIRVPALPAIRVAAPQRVATWPPRHPAQRGRTHVRSDRFGSGGWRRMRSVGGRGGRERLNPCSGGEREKRSRRRRRADGFQCLSGRRHKLR